MNDDLENRERARLALLDMVYETQLHSLSFTSELSGAQSLGLPPPLSSPATWSRLASNIGFREGISVVAQGDSWFDYIGNDIIQSLKHRGFAIKNYGTAGDTLENMLFGTEFRESNWERYPAEHAKVLESIKLIKPKFFLFSGGGNDIAGPELAPYLNHAGMYPNEPLRLDFLDFMFKKVFRDYYDFMIKSVKSTLPSVEIILHGYGHAIPTGKGVITVGPWRFIGPWLRPSLTAKCIINPATQVGVITRVIDVFNEMLADVAKSHSNVHYIDLRGIIKSDDWINELHLNHSGYEKVGQAYQSLMQGLMTEEEKQTLAINKASVEEFLAGHDSTVQPHRESAVGLPAAH